MKLLEGKTAIVTGAGGAIGASVAMLFAAQGARVVVNDLGGSLDGKGADPGAAQKVVDQIKAGGGEAIASPDDVSSWDEAQRLIARAREAFGRLDIVVNNAAVMRMASFEETTPELFELHNRVNLVGFFNVARAAAPHFKAQKAGAYVHMTSSTGLIGMAGNSPYMISKLGAVGLSRSIAIDMAKHGIRSNCVAPAAVSRMSPKRADEAVEAHYRRKLRPETTAPIVAFLASDAAADFNGQIVGVRGAELYLYNQPRPIRTLHRDDGWSVEEIVEQVGPAWRASLTPLEETYQVFPWSPL